MHGLFFFLGFHLIGFHDNRDDLHVHWTLLKYVVTLFLDNFDARLNDASTMLGWMLDLDG